MRIPVLWRCLIPSGAFAVLIPLAPQLQGQVPASSTAANTNKIYAIDLPTVLRLADAQNLDIQIARERLNEAQANQRDCD